MFYDITAERYETYSFSVEASTLAEAQRLGRELLPAFEPDTKDVTVQARLQDRS